MKLARRIITVFLALLTLFTLITPAFAAKDKTKNYLCLGDSIAAGAALTYDGTEYNPAKLTRSCLGFDFEVMQTAYHSLVADKLKAELAMGARSALRAVELRCLLGGGYNDYDPTYTWYNNWHGVFANFSGHIAGWGCPGDEFSVEALMAGFDRFDYEAEIINADVITLNLGSNDVFCSALLTGLLDNEALLRRLAGDPNFSEAIRLLNNGDYTAALKLMFSADSSLGSAVELLGIMNREMKAARKTFKENYTWIIDRIYELNPDAIVVGVGVFNPLHFGKLDIDDESDLSAALALTVSEVNSTIKSFALKHKTYYYADITGLKTHEWYMSGGMDFFEGGLTGADFLVFMMNIHPTLEGQEYISKQILSAIPRKFGGTASFRFGGLFQSGMIYKFISRLLALLSMDFGADIIPEGGIGF